MESRREPLTEQKEKPSDWSTRNRGKQLEHGDVTRATAMKGFLSISKTVSLS